MAAAVHRRANASTSASRLVHASGTQIDTLQLQRPTLVNHRRRLAVWDLNRGAQNFMPRDNDVQCPLQRIHIEFPFQTHGFGLIIHRHTGTSCSKNHIRSWAGLSGHGCVRSRGGIGCASALICPAANRFQCRGANQSLAHQRRLLCHRGIFKEVR